jgi:hypothetical protein
VPKKLTRDFFRSLLRSLITGCFNQKERMTKMENRLCKGTPAPAITLPALSSAKERKALTQGVGCAV